MQFCKMDFGLKGFITLCQYVSVLRRELDIMHMKSAIVESWTVLIWILMKQA